MSVTLNLPNIEEKFLPPKNWQTNNFTNPKTHHNIHYSFIRDDKNKATVICLPGLSEFSEKYVETARFFIEKGFNIYIIDWAYQGRSSRFHKNPHKRHSDGYESDISDLNFLIKNEINEKTPLYMLGHSMGAHLGLRYLSTQDHKVKAASFSPPMLGIESLKHFPICFNFLFKLMSSNYVFGGKDWQEETRPDNGEDVFSSDNTRRKIHNAWCLTNPALQVGNPTFKWLYESIKSIHFLKNKSVLKNIKIPVLLSYAEKETLVDNNAILKIVPKIENADLLELKESKHEVLVETDTIRDSFLNKTLEIFNQ